MITLLYGLRDTHTFVAYILWYRKENFGDIQCQTLDDVRCGAVRAIFARRTQAHDPRYSFSPRPRFIPLLSSPSPSTLLLHIPPKRPP